MSKDGDRSDWSAADYEEYIKTLLATQNALSTQEEQKNQTIFDLERKLKVKEAMETEYTAEITEMESTIENLRSEVDAKKASLATLQRALDASNDEIEELKTAVPARAPGCTVEVQTEEFSRGPEVTWVEWQEQQDKSAALGETIEELSLKVVTLQTAKEALQQDVSSWELKAVQLATDRDAALGTLADVKDLLEDCKSQLSLAHEEITLLREQPMLPGTRGNSLFGEVDDVRKEVAKHYDELKKKYLSLLAQHRRSAANPYTFAADRAGLQQLVAEVTATRDQLDFVETDSLRRRIQVQDEVIQGLTAEPPEPIKIVGDVGVAQMRYIEGMIDAGKQRERQLQIRLNDLSKSHLLMQEELAASQASLAATNAKLVHELAMRRIEFIDRTLKDANGVAGTNGDKIEALPADAPGPSNAASSSLGPADTTKKTANPPECVAGPSRENPVVEILAVAVPAAPAGPAVPAGLAAPEDPAVPAGLAAPGGPLQDMDEDDDARDTPTPPPSLPAPTIRGSARTPSFGPVGFARHGAAKRRASAEEAFHQGEVEGAAAKPRRVSETDQTNAHVRQICWELNSVEGAGRLQQRRSVRLSVDKLKAGNLVSNDNEEGVDVPESHEPMEEGDNVGEATNGSKPPGGKLHIPALKRQKMSGNREMKPKPANK